MAGLIDLHNHSLFGVDDGAQTIETCMQMLKASYEQGVRAICFTPHYNPSAHATSLSEVRASYQRVCSVSAQKYPDLALLLGNEVYAYPDSVDSLEAGKCIPLGEGRVVLVEFSPHVGYREMRNRFLSYQTAGYRPLLAHAERYVCLYEDDERVRELVDMRVDIQVNAESVLRFSHLRTYRFVHRLLSRRLVQVIASDMHEPDGAHIMLRACRKIERRYGAQYARQLFFTNPKRILLRK